jgi:hypothetical protein
LPLEDEDVNEVLSSAGKRGMLYSGKRKHDTEIRIESINRDAEHED